MLNFLLEGGVGVVLFSLFLFFNKQCIESEETERNKPCHHFRQADGGRCSVRRR